MTATASSLPLGTRLGEFELTGVLGEGGFSVVYLAVDHSLGRTVAIKEFMPSAIATRLPNGTVVPKAPQREDAFKAGLTSFQEEARLLTRFTHSALIHIHRIWEQNGTAYMAMQYCVGKTLRQIRHAEPEAAKNEDWLKATFAPILDALALLHTENCFHRDISPDNILILQTGAPVLLDFGAARQIIGDMTQALTVILKPGFAPIEQYADDTSLQQGTWTDVYGVGAVLYYMLVGKPPVASVARLVKDPMIKLADSDAFSNLSRPVREAIDHALAVYPQQRIQSIPDLCEALQLPAFMPNAFFGGEVAYVAPATDAASSAPAHPEARSKSVAGAMLDSYQNLQNSVLTRLTGRSPAPSAAEPDTSDAGASADTPASASPADPVPEASPGAEISSTFLANAAAFQHRSARRRNVTLAVAGLVVVATGIVFAASSLLHRSPSNWDTRPYLVDNGPPTTEKLTIAPAPDSSATAAPANHQTATASTADTTLATPEGSSPSTASSDLPTPSATSTAATAAGPAVAPPMPTAATATEFSAAPTETAPDQTSPERKKPRHAERPLKKMPPPFATAAPPPEPVFPAPMPAPAPAPVPAVSKKLTAAPTEAIPAKTSVVRLLIKPWGSVSVDGQPKGVSPPLAHLSLTPGPHQIVITNGNFPPVAQKIIVPEKGETAVFHRFSADW